jgi:putative sterol carrier protein
MERYAKLQSLVADREVEIAATFETLTSLLQDSGEKGSIQFRIIDVDRQRHWHLILTPKSSKLVPDSTRSPSLEIVTRSETWMAIAAGSLSPLEAFLQGSMRVRGDVELGKRLLAKLAGTEGVIDIC